MGAKKIYDFATLSGIDRLQWRSSQPRGVEKEKEKETEMVVVVVEGGGELWQRDG